MENKIIKSPLKYQGSKLKLIPWIKQVARFNPEKQRWIEPFLGSGVVALNMNAKSAIVNDINKHVIDLFELLHDKSYFLDGMKATLSTHDDLLRRYGETYYYEMRENYNTNFHPNTLMFLNHTCFNGIMRFNKKGGYNVPYGKNPNKLTESYREDLYNRLVAAQTITKDWEFKSGDYKLLFENVTKNDLIYLDPPYINRNNNYYDSWGMTHEKELHELVTNTDARVVMSTWYHANGETNECVNTLWNDTELHLKDHHYSVGAKKENRYKVIEALLTNF